MEKQNYERTGGKMRGTEENNPVKSREGGPQHMSCSFPCGWKIHLRRMTESSNEQSRVGGKGTELIGTCKQAGEAQNLLLTSKGESVMTMIIEIKSVSFSLFQASSGDDDCAVRMWMHML